MVPQLTSRRRAA